MSLNYLTNNLMKIFQVSEYISSAFNIILNEEQKNILFNYLETLYIKNYINNEILLNLIKAFILIFYTYPNTFDIYIKLLNSLSEEEIIKLFNLLKKIKLSYQMNMNENTLNKIIFAINDYIIINNNFNGLLNVYNIYDTIRLNKKIIFNNKVQLYIILLKKNSTINDTRQILGLLNKFL
jgi:hypothetical protein